MTMSSSWQKNSSQLAAPEHAAQRGTCAITTGAAIALCENGEAATKHDVARQRVLLETSR